MTMAGATVLGLDHQVSHHDDTEFGRAIALALSERHPVNTSGHVAQRLRCTKKAAENILAGHLSARTITRLVKAYGLGLIIDAGAAVTGQSLRGYILDQAQEARRDARRAEELARDLTDLEGRLASRPSQHPGGMGSTAL
jgi:hypothetical protein